MQKQTLFTLLACAALHHATAQLGNRSPLTLDQIMNGEKFVGYSPESLTWSADGKTLYFRWNPTMQPTRTWYKITLDNHTPRPIEASEYAQILPSVNFKHTNQLQAFSHQGDLYSFNPQTLQTKQLTQTFHQHEHTPVLLHDGQTLAYVAQGNVFHWKLATNEIKQITNFTTTEKSSPTPSAADQWLIHDQLGLFEVLRDRKHTRQFADSLQKQLAPKRPKAIYLHTNSVEPSPDGRFVVFTTANKTNSTQTHVPEWITESGYTQSSPSARPKVGAPYPSHSIGIYDALRDTHYTVSLKTIEGIYEKPPYLAEYHRDTSKKFSPRWEHERPVYVQGFKFSPQGDCLAELRATDNKDRWLVYLELATGTLRTLDRQRDTAWVQAPCVHIEYVDWLPDGKQIYFNSEETGFAHLYLLDVATGKKRALTQGNYEVTDFQLSNDGNYFYITTSEADLGERHFYKLNIATGEKIRLTTLKGNHEVTLSPNEEWLAIRYSYTNKPWEVYLQRNQAKADFKQITYSQTPDFQKYTWREPEVIYFKARDGQQVRARLYRPAKSVRNGAGVIFVHGAGYLQNVHFWWSNYFREYMFHNLLADNGYTVLDIDYRGSSGYGRNWRTGIYRHMGGRDLNDHLDGAKFLVEQCGVNSKKLGIYGGSYGGFITLMAMFTAPETFACGAALRSVTDWAHYNHGYTSNILNTPTDDSLAFRRSSPIYFADQLKGKLLMLHGMVDDNVQYQDIVRLAQRLIELRKNNWELAAYPVENHGFVEASSWRDEYYRIFQLFQTTLVGVKN